MTHPDIIFPKTQIIIHVEEGKQYRGNFEIKGKGGGKIRGLVYTSSLRVRFKEQGFEGTAVKLEFVYDGRGLMPGNVECGAFTVVCNGGEYDIKFTAVIEKPYLMTEYGKIQSIRDFKNLAMQDYDVAHRLFRSREFYGLLKHEEPRIYNLYGNMRRWSLGEQAMEEFLVGIKQKERIFLTLKENEKKFSNISEPVKELIPIEKNTWGYMKIKAETVGEFLSTEREEFCTEHFISNVYDFAYTIDDKKLHAGHNYGKIIFCTPYEELVYQVDVWKEPKEQVSCGERLVLANILKNLLKCDRGDLGKEVWLKDSLESLKKLYEESRNEIYLFMQAHACLYAGKEEKAKWILENYDYNRLQLSEWPEKNSYYLFLTACIRKEGSHVQRVIEEIEKAYSQNTDSWSLFCMMLNIHPEYKTPEKRLKAIKTQAPIGANEILFYRECYRCYREKKETLKRLGAFEIQVLNFAAKYRLISSEMAFYIANLASQKKEFNRMLLRLLMRLYGEYKEKSLLFAICTMLIKDNRTSGEYFKWYEMAVQEGLKIAQLYEYYMLSLDVRKFRGRLQKSVHLYFMYGNTLPYKKAAFLYADIIQNEDEEGQIYRHYREEMEKFAWSQLSKRHINEQLRIIYRKFLNVRYLDAKRMNALNDICHAYEVKTKNPRMKWILVIEKDGKVNQHIPYKGEGTKVYLYDKEARIVWESKDGMYYTDSIGYDTERLFYEPIYIELCKTYMDGSGDRKGAQEIEEVTFDSVKQKGPDAYELADVLKVCTGKIQETEYAEDDYLTFLAFWLFERGQYDQVSLAYLAQYYCGATKKMKRLWHAAVEKKISAQNLAEKIITQMLFAEEVTGSEEIFQYYYEREPYFRIKQAYLAYMAQEYVVKERIVSSCIFEIMEKEFGQGEELAQVCRIALLKFYAGKELSETLGSMLKGFMKEMRLKSILFPFYLKYPKQWLQELMLHDKVMVEYHAKFGGKVKLYYQIGPEELEGAVYQSEILEPVFENIYVKEIVVFSDECLRYQWKEIREEKESVSEKMSYLPKDTDAEGRYGRINQMCKEKGSIKGMDGYQSEEMAAEEMFVLY